MAKFTFFENWAEIFDTLDDGCYVAVSRALYRYGCQGVEPEFRVGSMEWVIWTAIKPNIDASTAKRESGSKGGRPKKSSVDTVDKTTSETMVKTTEKSMVSSDARLERIGKEEEVYFSKEKNKPSSDSVRAASAAKAATRPSSRHMRCKRCGNLVSAKSDGSGMFNCVECGEITIGEVA